MLLREAIRDAMIALGGQASVGQVAAWISHRHAGRWRDIATAMADLVAPRSRSSQYGVQRGFLVRVARGV
jgi:hypothetical protein